jgi:hypothetical protein
MIIDECLYISKCAVLIQQISMPLVDAGSQSVRNLGELRWRDAVYQCRFDSILVSL